MKMEGCVYIRVIKVNSPSDFLVSEVPAMGMSREAKGYQCMIEQLNENLDNDQIIKQSFTPQKGQVYAGKRMKDKRWYRVQVESWFDRRNGLNANCYLLDIGIIELIPVQSLRIIPAQFNHTRIPYQVKQCCLYGVRPLTRSMSPHGELVPTVVDKWDASANMQMNVWIKESTKLKMQVMGVSSTGVYQVKMYMETSDGSFCLNDRLVTEKYCVSVTDVPSDSEGSQTDSMSYSSSDDLPPFRGSDSTTQGRQPSHREKNHFTTRDIRAEIMAELGLTDLSNVKSDSSPSFQTRTPVGERTDSSQVDSNVNRSLTPAQGNALRLPAQRSRCPELLPGLAEPSSGASCNLLPSPGRSTCPDSSLTNQATADLDPGKLYVQLPEMLTADLGTVKAVTSPQPSSPDSSPGNLPSSLNHGSGLRPSPQKPFIQVPGNFKSNLTVLDYFRQTVPNSLVVSDSEASNSSGSSMTRNIRRITKELSVLSNGEQNCGSESDTSVNSDLSLTRYDTHSNRSLQDVVMNLQGKLSSLSTSPAPSPTPRAMGMTPPRSASDTEGAQTTPQNPCNSDFSLPPGTEDSFLSAGEESDSLLGRKQCSLLRARGSGAPGILNNTEAVRHNGTPDLFQTSGCTGETTGIKQQENPSSISKQGLSQQTSVDQKPVLTTLGLQEHDLSVESVLSGILNRDPTAPSLRTRRPNIPVKGSEGNSERSVRTTKSGPSRVCFSDDEPQPVLPTARAEKSPIDRSVTPTRNSALRSILKNASPVSPVPDDPSRSPVQNYSPLSIMGDDSTDRSSLDYSSASDQETPSARRTQKGKMGKVLAHHLLGQLSRDRKRAQPLHVDLQSEDPEKFGSFYRPPDGVLADGDIVPKPVEKLEDVALDRRVIKIMQRNNLSTIHLIQSYTWPAILRGRDVIGIAPHYKGQIMAYVAPLLSQLIESKQYPEGGGPLVLIICSSWRRAQKIQNMCETVVGELSRPRVMTMFGGGSEDVFNIPLINGCEVLIVTPHCLSRKLNKFVNLRRLGHLVIDEAETVMGNFLEQIKEVMAAFRDVLKQRGSQAALPRQLLVFGCQWTKRLESFWDAYMVEPIIVITSQFEASVYGRVEHYVTVLHPGQRLGKLVALMDSLMRTNSKIVVFANDEEEAATVYHTLSAQSYYVLLAMTGAELTPVLKEWHLPHKDQSRPVLVCTDTVTFEMNVTDANAIIHYGMADSKTKFGNRLRFTKDHYRKASDLKNRSQAPSSHIFVTEDCNEIHTGILNCLVDMLERTRSHIPTPLRRLRDGISVGRENLSNAQDLCYYVKAFGACKLRSHCQDRHIIDPEKDKRHRLTMTSTIPDQGEVKVMVTYVKNASRFFVRILQHRAIDGNIKPFDSLYDKLHEALQAWFAVPENRIANGPVQYGDLCCSPGDFCRVEVRDEGNVETYASQRTKTIKIFYVDVGRTAEISASSLLKLPKNFRLIPFQAVEAYLCRISPVDSDTDWVPKADHFMCSQVQDKELWGKIVLSLGGTLWLDPLVERVYHKSIQVTTTNTQIRSSLVRRGYAIENQQHLELLYEACKGKVDLPDYSRSVLDVEPEVETLPEGDEEGSGGEEDTGVFTYGYMSACDSPEWFHLQLADTQQELEKLMDKLDKEAVNLKGFMNERKIQKGCVCLAKFSVDSRWYRARILSADQEDKVEMFFVDYGDRETVSRADIKDIPEKYLRLPFQAIECSLPHVAPTGGSWEDAAADALWDLAYHYNGEKKQLRVTVKGKRPAEYAGAHRFLVELAFKSCDMDVDIVKELVYGKHVLADNPSIQPLFMPPVGDTETTDSRVEGWRDLCGTVYKSQTPLILRIQAVQLRNTLETLMEDSSLSEDLKDELMLHTWNLIRYSQAPSICTTLLPTLTQLILHNPSLVPSLMGQRFVAQLCCEVCRNKSIDVRLASLRSLLSLCPDERIEDVLTNMESLEALVVTVEECESIKVKTLAIELLARICTKSYRVMSNAKSFKAVDVIYDVMLKHQQDSDLAEAFCHFFAVLGDHQTEEYYSDFRKDGLLKLVVEIIRGTSNVKVIRWTTHLMHNLSERSRRNKTLLLEAGCVPVLKQLAQRFPILKPELSSQWNHLLTSLDVKAPREHLSGGRAMVVRGKLSADTQRSHVRSFSPEVSWYQNSFRVVLSVKLTGLTEDCLTCTYSENSVHFKAVCDGKLFAFEFSLCDNILPSKSLQEVRLKEVLISLKKEQKGRWKRLLKDKERPSFLSVDFERFQDSDDSDSNASDDNLFIVKHSMRGKPLPQKSSAGGISVARDSAETRPALSGSSESEDSLDDQNSDEYDVFKL